MRLPTLRRTRNAEPGTVVGIARLDRHLKIEVVSLCVSVGDRPRPQLCTSLEDRDHDAVTVLWLLIVDIACDAHGSIC